MWSITGFLSLFRRMFARGQMFARVYVNPPPAPKLASKLTTPVLPDDDRTAGCTTGHVDDCKPWQCEWEGGGLFFLLAVTRDAF